VVQSYCEEPYRNYPQCFTSDGTRSYVLLSSILGTGLTDPAMASKLDTNTRAIFVLAAKQPPYNVYGNPFYDFAGYGNVFSVNKDGALEKNIQNYEYSPKTGIHGMVFDSTETYLYSADLRANKIWTHKKDKETGQLTLVNALEAPAPGDHPRWVAIHPSGNYLYVLMEAGNRLAVYVIDEQSHIPTFTQITYPLIPPGSSSSPSHHLSNDLRNPQPKNVP
jgi:carboxy-cis,cis-muconate cyclase